MNRFFIAVSLTVLPVAFAQLNPATAPLTPPDQISVQTSNPTAIPTAGVHFDVFSFRLNKDRFADNAIVMRPAGDGFTAVHVSMRQVIRFAFTDDPLEPFGVHGQPEWVDSDHYDIQAKIAPEHVTAWQHLTAAERKAVLQDLLGHLLALKYQMDDAERPFYALTVGKSGPHKMTETPRGQPFPTGRSICHWMPGNEIVGESCSMEGMADQLTRHTDHPVLDQTGLFGRYSFTVVFDRIPDPRPSSTYEMSVDAATPEVATPVIASGLKQLGLELVPGQGKIKGIVIESIQRPPEN